MVAFFFSFLVWFCFAPFAWAAEPLVDRLTKCTAITDGVKRLECFDAVSQEYAKKPTISQKKGDRGFWVARSETSPIDDSKNVSLFLEAESEISGWMKTIRPVLIVRCKEKETDVYIKTGMAPHVEDLYTASVTLRFDKEKARSYSCNKSTDDEALFFPQPIPLIREILKHETMLFQFTPFNASPTRTTFQIRGLPEVIGEVQQACHWH